MVIESFMFNDSFAQWWQTKCSTILWVETEKSWRIQFIDMSFPWALEWVNMRVSEQMSAAKRAGEASSAGQENELALSSAVRANKRMERRTVGSMTMKSTRGVLGHSLLRSLVRSHRALIRLLRTDRFARVLRWPLFRSLAHSGAHGKEVDFIQFQPSAIKRCRRKMMR